jgi:hypothetical protein
MHEDGFIAMKKFSLFVLITALSIIPLFMGCEGSPTDMPIFPAGPLMGINLEPAQITINAGNTTKFIATGIFPGGVSFDLTELVTWLTSNSNVAYFLADGTMVANAPGTALISATFNTGISQTVSVTVPGAPSPDPENPTVAVLRSITVTPKFVVIDEEGDVQFTCTGNFSDESTQDYTSMVEWRTSNDELGFITPNGVYYSIGGSGVLTVSAKYNVFESNYVVLAINKVAAP